MKITFKYPAFMAALLLMMMGSNEALAQFTAQWLDIGSLHATYVESGARHEISNQDGGMQWPAIMRESSTVRARAFWIGVRDWTSEEGTSFPTYVARIGPRGSGAEYTSPVQNRLIAKYEDTQVNVDGALSFDNVAIVDEVDPTIPADRMIDNIHNMRVGITVNRKVYAYTNAYHDNYHVIDQTYTNTGNTDDDDDIELPDQTLKDVYFFYIHRWRGNNQAADCCGSAQTWGKFSMVDVVGDGHEEYPVDFSAIYLWYGYTPEFTAYQNLGGPLFNDNSGRVATGDSVGRLSGALMQGRVVIHADNSTTDRTYDPAKQPATFGFMDQDEVLTSDGSSHADYYELGILTRENPARNPGCETCSSRMYPHYSERVQPDERFWEPSGTDASQGKQGGFAATTAYGPYTIPPGESIRVVVAEAVDGMDLMPSIQVGRAYKRLGPAVREAAIIEYDANGDGTIDCQTYRDTWKENMFTGNECLTKNQWFFTARDSLFQTFQRALDLYAASSGMTQYPIPQAPLAPMTFNVDGKPDQIELSWIPMSGGPPITGWELWRTTNFEDNLYPFGPQTSCDTKAPSQGTNCVFDYQLVTTLPASTTSYNDTDVIRGTDYYYYLQAVGEPQPNDPKGINGTPGGVPLKSSRYLTQTYQPVNLKRPPGASISAARVVPNPVNLAADQTIRFAAEDEIAFFDIPGQCSIKIYTELGEFVQEIQHTDGSGDEKWNLTTSARQLLVSGIYIAVITDLESNAQEFLKFVVIR